LLLGEKALALDTIKDFERAVHRHSNLIRLGRKAILKLRYNSQELDRAIETLRKITEERRKLINIMRSLLSAAYIPQNLNENIDLLTFFVLEVSVNEDRELLSRFSYVIKRHGIELEDEDKKELSRARKDIEELERVSKELLSRIKS